MMSLETLLQAAEYIELQEQGGRRRGPAGADPPPPRITFQLATSEADPRVPALPDAGGAVFPAPQPAPRNGFCATAPVAPSTQVPPAPAHAAPLLHQKLEQDVLGVRSNTNGLSQSNGGAVTSPPGALNGAFGGIQVRGAGTREVHNKLEKNRRAHLKECFELLKRQLPTSIDDKKTSNLSILGSAIRYIQVLRRKERESEHELERLAREKIAAQQRLSTLRRQAAARRRDRNLYEHHLPERGGGEQMGPEALVFRVAGQPAEVVDNEFQERMETAASVITSSSDKIAESTQLRTPSPGPAPPYSIVAPSIPSPGVSNLLYHKPKLQPVAHTKMKNLLPQESVVKATNLYKIGRSTPPLQQVQTIYPAHALNGLTGVHVSPFMGVSLAGVSLTGIPVTIAPAKVTVAHSPTISITPSVSNTAPAILNLSQPAAVRKNALSVTSVPQIQSQHPAQSGLKVSSVTHVHVPQGVVVGGALQLLSPGSLRVLHAPPFPTTIDLHNTVGAASLQRRNGTRIIENGHITLPSQPQAQGDNQPQAGLAVGGGLSPLVMSQPGTHIITTTSQHATQINGKVMGTQYLPTTIVKPVVVVSSSPSTTDN